MATTTYTVRNEQGDLATASKKSKAIELADAAALEHKLDAEVVTGKGAVVHTSKAPRKIKMSKPYTRVVEVPAEVVETIDGARVAYKRGRKGAQFALLDDGRGDYRIWDVDRGENVPVEVATTRQAGRWFADERDAYRASTPVD